MGIAFRDWDRDRQVPLLVPSHHYVNVHLCRRVSMRVDACRSVSISVDACRYLHTVLEMR